MFGPTNFTFVYNNCKFILFDDIVWEKNVEDPDFDWLMKNIINDNNYTHVIPMAHIPPWDEQFAVGNELVYNLILANAAIDISIHGHIHGFTNSYRYNDFSEIQYITTDDLKDRNFILLTINKSFYEIERVKF